MNKIEYNTRILLESRQSTKEEPGLGTKAVGLGAAGLVGSKVVGKTAGLGKILAATKGSSVGIPIREESRWEGAKKSAVASALTTGAINGVAALAGSGVPANAILAGSAIAGLKGGALGAVASGGRDTLVKSSILPAGIVAATAPLTNMAFDAIGHDNVEINAPLSTALTGGIGATMWALRNRKNKNRQYI